MSLFAADDFLAVTYWRILAADVEGEAALFLL